MIQDPKDQASSNKYARIAAHALGAVVGFSLFGLIARICFPDNAAVLAVMLVMGNIVGWLLTNTLYNSFNPRVWIGGVNLVRHVGGVGLIFAAGELWDKYWTLFDVNEVSLMTLSQVYRC